MGVLIGLSVVFVIAAMAPLILVPLGICDWQDDAPEADDPAV